jgi:hypothetical protein
VTAGTFNHNAVNGGTADSAGKTVFMTQVKKRCAAQIGDI